MYEWAERCKFRFCSQMGHILWRGRGDMMRSATWSMGEHCDVASTTRLLAGAQRPSIEWDASDSNERLSRKHREQTSRMPDLLYEYILVTQPLVKSKRTACSKHFLFWCLIANVRTSSAGVTRMAHVSSSNYYNARDTNSLRTCSRPPRHLPASDNFWLAIAIEPAS